MVLSKCRNMLSQATKIWRRRRRSSNHSALSKEHVHDDYHTKRITRHHKAGIRFGSDAASDTMLSVATCSTPMRSQLSELFAEEQEARMRDIVPSLDAGVPSISGKFICHGGVIDRYQAEFEDLLISSESDLAPNVISILFDNGIEGVSVVD